MLGIVCTSAAILIIFATGWRGIFFPGIPAIDFRHLFFPFGAVLFSLAGWTSIEPSYEIRKNADGAMGLGGGSGNGNLAARVSQAIASGTAIAGLLYIIFVAGIVGSGAGITPDTVSGLTVWPLWKKDLIAFLGLLAVATVYLPLSGEIKHALEGDLGWSKPVSRSVVALLPLGFVLAGFNNFLLIIGFVGGVFLSAQYIIIISVGRKALALPRAFVYVLDLALAAFILGAIYSAYVFVVQ